MGIRTDAMVRTSGAVFTKLLPCHLVLNKFLVEEESWM